MGILESLFGPSREKQMEELVKQSSMEYTMYPDQQFLEVLEDFNIFQAGSKKVAKHLFSIQDENKVSVKIFDYKYTTRNSKRTTDHWQTVVVLTASDLSLAHFRIYSKHAFSGLEKFFGGQDIDISYDEAFNEKFIVRSVYPDDIHHHLNPTFRNYMIESLDVDLEVMNYFIVLNINNLLKCHVDQYEAYYFHIFKIYEALKSK